MLIGIYHYEWKSIYILTAVAHWLRRWPVMTEVLYTNIDLKPLNK